MRDLSDPSTVLSSLKKILVVEGDPGDAELVRGHLRAHVSADAIVHAETLADPIQIEQVLLNLSTNARDAMPEGGEIFIETANVALGPRDAAAGGEVSPGPYVMLSVTDTGAGMDEGVKARALEPFFTTKGVGEGTGLGLSTVLGIVTQSGGAIDVESEPGLGSTFKIYLPRVEAEPEPARAGPAGEAPRGSETVLIVDDEDIVRTITARMLDRCGYTTLPAESGEEALALAAARREPIHLLLTDLVMPHMGGHDLAVKVRALHPEARVLYVSGYAPGTGLNRGALEEGEAFLQKPFTLPDLATKVRALLDGPWSGDETSAKALRSEIEGDPPR